MLHVDIKHFIYVRMTDDACVIERRCTSEGVSEGVINGRCKTSTRMDRKLSIYNCRGC